jgi:hypothetical protein
MKKTLAPLLLIIGFGLLKTPVETRLLTVQKHAGFQLARLNLGTRAQLGQAGFVAALSGFRALMADLLWIRAGTAFDQTAWSKMELLLRSATQLQPRAALFWEMAHYHMAYDAATSVRYDETAQPSSALRRKAELDFIHIGQTFLEDGLSFLPNSSRLWERLGDLYSRRLNDPLNAADAYAKASQQTNAMAYLRRFSAYELAKIPGREKEAYERLKALYLESPSQRVETLVHLIARLEEKLAVPQEHRAYSKQTASDPVDTPTVR